MTRGSLAAALAELGATADRLAALTRGLTRDVVAARPSSGEFSILENVWHMRDIEADGYLVRIGRLLAENEPLLADLDGARLAAERRYSERELADGLNGFRAARQASVAALTCAGEGSLRLSGNLEAVGPITLGELVGKMLEHDRGHLGDIQRLLPAR
jgi:hypothetical protein